MKAIIVEDELIVADHLTTILTKNNCDVITTAETYEEALDTISKAPDFYFLDIRIASIQSGIDIGKRLQDHNIPFVYITANNELEVMKKAVKTEPVTYITKPFKERDVLAALELVRLKVENKRKVQILGSRGEAELKESDIIFCQADGVYTKIITVDKEITQRIPLKEFHEKLSKDFVRIHRSFVVNKSKITSKKANSVFCGEVELPISRSYKSAF